MKILHVCTSPSWGGMEMSVGRLVELQRKEGHQSILACQTGSPLYRWSEERNLDPFSLGTLGIRSWRDFLELRRLLKSFGPDLIHVHYSRDLNWIVPLNQTAARQPLIFTKQLGSAVVKRDAWHNFLYGRVTRATAISNFIKKNLVETTAMPPERIDLVYLGTDVQRFRPDVRERDLVRRELGFHPGDTVIGMLGRMSPGKGYEDFIEAVADLKSLKLRFLMIGGASRGEEDYAAGIQKLARQRLGDRVIITGFKSDRERYLRALDLFVFPSHAESFGLALCEAMATGLACVAYMKDGVCDIIRDGENGLGVRVREVDDLRQKIELLLNRPDLRKRLGLEARKTVVERFSEDRMLSDYRKTYLKALKQR